MDINAITKHLVEQGKLQPIPAGVTQRTYEDLLRTAKAAGWTPPTLAELKSTWEIIEPAITAVRLANEKKEQFLNDRHDAYEQAGVTIEALVEAIVEHIIEKRPAKLSELQAKRMKVKSNIPKPKGSKR